MGWASLLGNIGAWAATIATGGAAAPLIPIAAAAGQAYDSHNAEKKAAKQQEAAYGKVADLYQPQYQIGMQAQNALATGFGLPGLNAPAMASAPVGPDMAIARPQPSRIPQAQMFPPPEQLPAGGRLADLARRLDERNPDRPRSSYRSIVRES